ncbi:MAG: DUF4112 domain-containing protein [Myxococcota bacterium]
MPDSTEHRSPAPASPPEREAEALDALQSVAERRPWIGRLARGLDDLGLGFGLDAILGLVLPGVGDALTGTASFAILATAVLERVPFVILLRMLMNVLVDTLVGMVPVLGDLFDVAYRANLKNLALLEAHAGGETPPSFRDWLVVGLAFAIVAAGVVAPFFLFGRALGWLGQALGA